MTTVLDRLVRTASAVWGPLSRSILTLFVVAALAAGSTPTGTTPTGTTPTGTSPTGASPSDGAAQSEPLRPAIERGVEQAHASAGGGSALPLSSPSPRTDTAGDESPTPPLPAEVPLQEPDLLITGLTGSAPGASAAMVEGTEHVATASPRQSHLVTGPDEAFELTAFAIDPVQFRPLTPEITAQTVGVWERLREGDIVVRHDVAHELELELGGTVELQIDGVRLPARVGAFASNGAPPVADLLIPADLARRFPAGTTDTLVIAVDDDHDPESVGAAILETLGEGELTIREAPETQQAGLGGVPSGPIEPFTYTDLGDGMIIIDSAWVEKWIVTVDVPYLGRTRCNRAMLPQLFAALDTVAARGLTDLLKPEQFAGCWVPRHIDWNPAKPLSMHAWGLAIDINAQDNWLGQTPTLDGRIVEAFERCGFAWGGRWSRPDGMHFELDRIVDPDACRGS